MNQRHFSILFLLLAQCLLGSAQKLEIHALTENAFVFTTYKEFAGKPFPSNGLYLVTEEGVLLIDMPWDTTQCLPLLDSIEARHHLPVRWSISTHFHDDRTGAIDILKRQGVKTYSSQQTQALCREKADPIAEFGFSKDTIFQLGEWKIETFYPGAGHAPDNIVIWIPEMRLLYGGCFVKSTDSKGLGYLGDADTKNWARGLKVVKRKFRHPKWIIPGHQAWATTKSLKHTAALLKSYLKEESQKHTK